MTFAKVVGRLYQTLINWTLLTLWDGRRFVARADEKLTAFTELELAICLAANWFDELPGFFQTRRHLEPGSGQEAASRGLSFPVSDLQW